MSTDKLASDFKFEMSSYNDGFKKIKGTDAVVERCQRAILSAGLVGDTLFGVNIKSFISEFNDKTEQDKIIAKCRTVLERTCPGHITDIYLTLSAADPNKIVIGISIDGIPSVFLI